MTAAEHLAPTLDAAHRYTHLGLRVIPIAPGQKRPTIPAWQDAATTDPTVVTAWWTGLYRGHGIGIAPDQLPDGRWWFAVDIDTHDIDGHDTWHDLQQTYPNIPVPDGPRATTGGGGTHLLLAAPTEIRNGRLGPGIDIRGHGGQIVAEPSTHPNGQPYQWEDGAAPWDIPIPDAPGWLLAMLQRDETPPPAQPAPAATGDRPGDLWAATVTWDQLLTADGWTHSGTGPEGETRWTRPGKDRRDGISATTGYRGSDILKVFTSSVATLEPDATYTKIGYLAATHYHGDFAAAASALRAAGHHAPTPNIDAWLDELPDTPAADGQETAATGHGWEPTDLAAILHHDYDPPRPTIGRRQGGGALFYPGRVNALYAPSGTGKSWIAMWACAEQLAAGHGAIYIDLEDHAASVAARLAALGVPHDTIVARFAYIAPELRWNPTAAAALAKLVTTIDATIVVIDSTGESMALDGVKPNDDDAVAVWFRHLPRRLADTGPAVILTDHVPKDKDRPRGYAIGSQRKRAAIDGLAYDVDARVAPAKGTDGHLGLTVAKDRNGTYQAGAKVADVHVVSSEDGQEVAISVEAPEAGHRPTILMERVSRYLEAEGPQSKRTIEREVQGKGVVLRIAVDCLAMEGYISEEPGRTGGATYRHQRPFRDGSDHLDWVPEPVDNHHDDPSASPVSQARPSVEGRASETTENEARPLCPDSRKTGGTGDALRGVGPPLDTPTTDQARPPFLGHCRDGDDGEPYELF